jgi:hypothetical protein
MQASGQTEKAFRASDISILFSYLRKPEGEVRSAAPLEWINYSTHGMKNPSTLRW